MNYYNEFDPKAAAWLRELIQHGLIPNGTVDERSIAEVQPGEIQGFTQCHFFAGIGGWAYALRLAGWPDDVPVWTGSCPCQPFSAAGKQRGAADERHMWPEFYRLIAECRPSTVFGEQVASLLGREWLSGVRSDVEALGYAVGAADMCAAGVGAPHIRQRLFWVANSNHSGSQGRGRAQLPECSRKRIARARGYAGGVGDALLHGSLADPIRRGTCAGEIKGRVFKFERPNSPWSRFDIIPCRDGKSRRVKSKSQRMADGVSDLLDALRNAGFSEAEIEVAQDSFPLAHWPMGRVALLRGYGNAINIGVAVAFVKAYIECRETSI